MAREERRNKGQRGGKERDRLEIDREETQQGSLILRASNSQFARSNIRMIHVHTHRKAKLLRSIQIEFD